MAEKPAAATTTHSGTCAGGKPGTSAEISSASP